MTFRIIHQDLQAYLLFLQLLPKYYTHLLDHYRKKKSKTFPSKHDMNCLFPWLQYHLAPPVGARLQHDILAPPGGARLQHDILEFEYSQQISFWQFYFTVQPLKWPLKWPTSMAAVSFGTPWWWQTAVLISGLGVLTSHPNNPSQSVKIASAVAGPRR